MGAVTAIVTTIVATAGAVALYRFIDGKTREFRGILAEARKTAERGPVRPVIDYERDPATGVYKPRP